MTEATPQHLLECFALVYYDLLKRPDFVLEVMKSNDVMDLIRFRSEGLQRREICFRSENSPILPELPKVTNNYRESFIATKSTRLCFLAQNLVLFTLRNTYGTKTFIIHLKKMSKIAQDIKVS
ncbi:hypothetical protein AVEN_38962-1 [Araneus ventricosus]|uniref:Uncharacterized protein n=1 Tax=Araneus ventricosus TaxID=182803 RepID=A0A4Y2VXX9_ARAVE|nr:hypothetical protein AVEN_38962-1 [Araneus ventricosus]